VAQDRGAFFDVDGTLVDTNVVDAYLHYVLNRGTILGTAARLVKGLALAPLYAAADLLVLPSLSELFSRAMYEAAASGLPVVATPVGSNLEIIEDGVNGFLARDADEWYARLRQLLDDAALRRRMGRAARATVEQNFSLTGQIDFVERVFRSAAALRGNRVGSQAVLQP
jgi:glycosyltransferase involved in cell wall biosynthesis